MRKEKEQLSIFEMLAKREGVSPDEMRAKIAARIQAGLHDPDPDKRARGSRYPMSERYPRQRNMCALWLKN